MRSPCVASFTVIWHRLFRRAAKLVVKPGGMCCVMTMAGASAGIWVSTSLMASVPPVDAPMAISFSVDTRPSKVALLTGGLAAAGAPAASVPAGAAAAAAGLTMRCTWAVAAMRIFSTISLDSWVRPLATPTRGLETKSTAPSSSARMVTSAPRSVSVEIISTGMGRRRMMRPRKSMPSILGISMSRVITSGFFSRIISRATRGSLAVPMHSMSC